MGTGRLWDENEIKTFSDKKKSKSYVCSRSALKEKLTEFLQVEEGK